MPEPIKSVADFFVIGAGINGELEPYVVGTPSGGFQVAYSTQFSTPGDFDLRVRTLAADGSAGSEKSISTGSSAVASRQGSIAYLEDGRYVVTWVDEPNPTSGNVRDIKAEVFFASGVTAVPEFTVAGGVENQQNPIVTASPDGGFAVAYVDYNGTDNIVLKTYNQAGALTNTIDPANINASVYNNFPTAESYDPLDMVALENGNYVLAWSTDDLDTRAQIFSPGGAKIGAEFEVAASATQQIFPRITVLADGRFLVTTTGQGLAQGTIYNESGTLSVATFEIATGVSNTFAGAFADVAAFEDGRFVAVWVDNANEIQGQVFFGDGTKDGAGFAVAAVTTGNQFRPTVDVLADGRFVVAWETTEIAEPSIKAAIFDPREAALELSGTRLDDDFVGTGFADLILGGRGDDRIDGGAGDDTLIGESGNDTLFGGAGKDTLKGGTGVDALSGGADDDVYYVDRNSDVVLEAAGEGTDFIFTTTTYQIAENAERLIALEGPYGRFGLTARNFQNDILIGNSESNVFIDQFGRDIFIGGGGNDFFRFIANLDPVNNVNRINDFNSVDDQFQLQQTIFSTIATGILSASQFRVGTEAVDADDRIIYDSANGVLYFDPDGINAMEQIEFANVTAGITITADDFQIF